MREGGFRDWLLSHRSRGRFLVAVVLGLILGFAVIATVRTGATDRFEWVVYDLLMRSTSGYRSRSDSRADPNIVIVSIDTGSIREFSADPDQRFYWPWPRDMYGAIIRFCRSAKSGPVVFDGLLGPTSFDTTEPALIDTLAQTRRMAPPVVVGGRYDNIESLLQPDPDDLARLAVPVELGEDPPVIPTVSNADVPHKPFLVGDLLVGNVAMRPEGDGVVRRLRPLVRLRQGERELYLPSLSLVAAWAKLGRPPIRLAGRSLWLGERRVPLDAQGEMAVRYVGPPWTSRQEDAGTYYTYRSYTVISRQLLLEDGMPESATRHPVKPEEFAGKLVLVGATAEALLDIKASPFSDVHPGVEIHANAVDNLLNGCFLDRRWDEPGMPAVWLSLAVLGTSVGVGVSALRGVPVLLLLLAGIAVGAWAAFGEWGIAWRVIPPLAALLLGYVAGLTGGYALESLQKQWVQGAFSQFLSPEVLDVLLRNPERLALGGERQTVTVFFSDVAGFTALSEKVTPEELVARLNTYLTRMSDILIARGAYIDKFIGDAIMAFWNAPTPAPDHAVHACRAALDCVAAMHRLAAEFAAEGFPALACRIGINTGPVVCGMMGSRRKLNYTVMGDTVNTASRLEGANKTFGSVVLTSEETVAAAGPELIVREVDLVRVKGRSQPVRLYEVLGWGGELEPQMQRCLDLYRRGLELYRQREWKMAEAVFNQAAELDHPGGHNPSLVYVRRCQHFQQSPPPADWDGVYEMQTK